jgi:hypothetical protein
MAVVADEQILFQNHIFNLQEEIIFKGVLVGAEL